ncbi:hypothetical protein AwDysgo_15400 [Bacteroidales bacterium]|nr:hypothetical protein AwDysgo_15400 [Bacteroidales bacterium]
MNRRIKTNYILRLALMAMLVFTHAHVMAQIKPGGVGLELELWLSSDKLQATTPSDGTRINSWIDRSTNARDFIENAAYPTIIPLLSYDGMNYHPTLKFDMEESLTTVNNRRRKLVSKDNFTTNLLKSYYTFIVSELDTENALGYSTVFAFSQLRNDNNGWASTGALWHSTRALNYTNPVIGKHYGISTFIRPNVVSTPVQRQYQNASEGPELLGRVMANEIARKAVIGSSDLGYANNFSGDVQEIIIFSAPAGSFISTTDLAKVHSYLAIKYGLTLDAQQPDYIDTKGDSFWTGSDNAGYQNHIFGIGRDDKSGLYQKQSASYDFKTVSVYLNDLTEINEQNTGTLDDYSFLMLGSNGRREYTNYFYNSGQAFENANLAENVNYRHQTILKAQTSGLSSFTVNMSTHIGARYILVSQDSSFNPASTRIYQVSNRDVKNVTINNGDYIGFATFEKAPGGVINGLRLWMNATNPSSITTDANGDIIKWVDQSSNQIRYEYMNVSTANKAPGYGCAIEMNFHRSALFRNEGEFLSTNDGVMAAGSPQAYTFFTALNNNFGRTNRSYPIGFGSTLPNASSRRPALGVMETTGGLGRGRFYETGGSGSVDGKAGLFVQNATTIMYHQINKGTGGASDRLIRFEFDGTGETITASTAGLGNGARMNTSGILGSASVPGRNLIGSMSEIFAYERELSQEEKNNIYSYLGLKYAITLDLDKGQTAVNFDYLLSDGTPIWPGTSSANHQAYHNNVASIVRDDYADLDNKQARSTNAGSSVHMGIGNRLGCNPDLTGLSIDKSAITWGHDNAMGEINFAGDTTICGHMDSRLKRIWMVDKTNLAEQKVMLAIKNPQLLPPAAQIYLLVAESGDALRNNQWNSAIPMNFDDGQHQINYKLIDKYTYFTFGIKILPGVCLDCEFEGVKKLEFTNASWNRGDLANTFNLGDGFIAGVEVDIENPASFVSRYPRASNFKSLREYRRGDVTKTMTTKISLSKSALANFEIFEIDLRAGRYDEVEVYGICGGSIVHPTLSYTLTQSKSSYTIVANKARAKKRPESSYTSTRGRMQVDFDYPVETIIIKHRTTGRSGSAYKRIGIGSMEFYCRKPLPEVNEDGLIFTKRGPAEASLCDEIAYVFSIINTNCNPKPVDFSDLLPAGMKWLSQSLSLEESIELQASVNKYGGSNQLNIGNLIVPGATTLRFRARAVFDDTALAGDYENRANISYIGDGGASNLQSCDPFISADCRATITKVINTGAQLLGIKVLEYKVSKSCYVGEDSDLLVTIKLDNPNPITMPGAELSLGFNEEFTYVAGSLSTSLNLSSPASIDMESGAINIENFNLPTGQSTLSYKLKSPAVGDLVKELDADGNIILNPTTNNPEIIALDIDFDLSVNTDDDCLFSAFSNANGAISLDFCQFKKNIISNKMITPRVQ